MVPNWPKKAYDRTTNLYSGSQWTIEERAYAQSEWPQSESIFTVGNGFIGIRGCFEEGHKSDGERSEAPVYLNGVYDTTPIRYHEPAFGYATDSDTRVPVPDATSLEVYIGDERVAGDSGTVESYQRQLDIRRGILRRTLSIRMPSGHRIRMSYERVAFLHQPQLAAIKCRCVLLNHSARIRIVSSIKALDSDNSVSRHRADSAFRDPPRT